MPTLPDTALISRTGHQNSDKMDFLAYSLHGFWDIFAMIKANFDSIYVM